MRIAFLVDSFPCLSETFILNQITGLIDLGHDVEIFAARRGDTGLVHDDVVAYRLLSHTHFYNEVPERLIVRLLKFPSYFFRHGPIRSGLTFKAVNVFRLGLEALSLRLYYRALPFMQAGPFDILQCHFGQNGLVGTRLKEAGIAGKVVTMFHGYDIRRGLKEGGQIYRHLFVRGDLFLAISQANREQLVRFGVSPDKVRYHPVGIDLRQLPLPAEKPQFGHGPEVIILTVARLVQEKGLDDGIKAVARLLEGSPGLLGRYRIVGDGPLREELHFLVARLNLSNIVEFIGPQKHSDVIEEMKKADIFLLPSRTEVLPVVLMEAQAMQLPVVATDVGSVSEIVRNGWSGFLVQPGNLDEMVQALKSLLGYPEKGREMGAKGRETVFEKFDATSLNRRLVDIYKELQ